MSYKALGFDMGVELYIVVVKVDTKLSCSMHDA